MENRCEFCESCFTHQPVKKIIRGKLHAYCSESCYRLWFFDVPRDTRKGWLPKYTTGVAIDTKELK